MDRPGRSFERVFGTPSAFPMMRRSLPMPSPRPPVTRLRTPVPASQQPFLSDPSGMTKPWLNQRNVTCGPGIPVPAESNGGSGEPSQSQLMYQYQSNPKPVPPGQNNYNQPYSGYTPPQRPPMFQQQQPYRIPPQELSSMVNLKDEVTSQLSPSSNISSERCWASEDFSFMRDSADRTTNRINCQPMPMSIPSGQPTGPSPYMMMQRRQQLVGIPSGAAMPGLGNSPPSYPQDRPSLHLGRNLPLDSYEMEIRIRGQEKQRKYRDDLLQQAEEDKKRKAADRARQAEDDRLNEIRNVERSKQEQYAVEEQRRKDEAKNQLKETRKQEAAEEIKRAAEEARKKKAQQEMEVKRLQKQMEEVTLKSIAPNRQVTNETPEVTEQFSARPKSVKRIPPPSRSQASRQPTAKPRSAHQSQSSPAQIQYDATTVAQPPSKMPLMQVQESQSLNDIQLQTAQQSGSISQAQSFGCSPDRAPPDVRTFLKHFNTAVEALTSKQSTTYEGFLYDLETLSYHCRYRPTREAFNQYIAEEQNIKAETKADLDRISRSRKKKRQKYSEVKMFDLMERNSRSYFPTYSPPQSVERPVLSTRPDLIVSPEPELDAPEVNWASDDPEFRENSPAPSESSARTYVVSTFVAELNDFDNEHVSTCPSPNTATTLDEGKPGEESRAISLHSDIEASDHDIDDEDGISVFSERKQDDDGVLALSEQEQDNDDEQTLQSNNSESDQDLKTPVTRSPVTSRRTSASSCVSARTEIQDQFADNEEPEASSECTLDIDTSQETSRLMSQGSLISTKSSISEPSLVNPKPIQLGTKERNHEIQKSSKSGTRKGNRVKKTRTAEKSARKTASSALAKTKRPFY